jgi:hypothetical protein
MHKMKPLRHEKLYLVIIFQDCDYLMAQSDKPAGASASSPAIGP